MQKESIKCPLCRAKAPWSTFGDTHIWKCIDCPFMAIEYYNDKDIDNLKESLNYKHD